MISKRRLRFWLKEFLLIFSFLAIITVITYCPAYTKNVMYFLAKIKNTEHGFQFVPVSGTMTWDDCRKKERKSKFICIADIQSAWIEDVEKD